MKTFRICQYIRSGLILFLAAVSLSATLHAQLVVTTAALQGTVTDPTGAIIPQSTVTLASAENGISKTYVTSSAGRYIFSQLPASTYQLTIRATGFKDYIQKGISLDPGQSAEIDVRLTIGGVEEQVIITSEAPLINTADANISNNIDGKEIVELPLNLRNVFGLVTLNSSVNNSSQAQMTLLSLIHISIGENRLDLRLHVGQIVAGQQRRGQYGPQRKVRAILGQRQLAVTHFEHVGIVPMALSLIHIY